MDNIKNDKYYINQILGDIDKIIKYTSNVSYDDFMDDEQLIDAVLFRLIQMTENIKKLSIMFKEQHASVSWNDIVGFRNRIVHDYGKTDYTIVYEVVSNDIPDLKEVLLKIKWFGEKMEIRKYTKDLIPDIIDFEKRLREEEDFWG